MAALLIGKAIARRTGYPVHPGPASTLHGNGQYLPVTGLITVLGNLIENSFDAMRGAPRMSPVKSPSASGRGPRSPSERRRHRPGMTEEVKQHIFERGFSTKGDGRGTGLALVQDIIETYNGTIRVESDLGVGTSFIITLTDHT